MKKIGITVALIAVIVLGFILLNGKEVVTRGVTNFDTLGITGLQIGTSGSSLSQVLTGTMNCTGGATVGTSTTGAYQCAVTGVVSGDKVFASLTTTPAGIYISGVVASSTSGFVQLTLGNTATSPTAPTGATTSVQYLIVR
jgi:hypothetical protein